MESPDGPHLERHGAGLVSEYAAVIQKVGSNDAWASSFVAMYFAFTVSIATAVGFLAYNLNMELADAFDLTPGLPSPATRNGLFAWMLLALSLLGIVLNGWAISMVVDYTWKKSVLFDHLTSLELALHGVSNKPIGFATIFRAKQQTSNWRPVQYVIVGSVMVMFFVPWFLVLFSLVS
jgi:hypothetical protein